MAGCPRVRAKTYVGTVDFQERLAAAICGNVERDGQDGQRAEDRIPQNTIAERGPRVHGEGETGGGGETVGVRLHVL